MKSSSSPLSSPPSSSASIDSGDSGLRDRASDPSFEQKRFIEEVGMMFELVGLPRMAGRIFGWLLISNPPHQSPGEIAEVLQASKGSISTMTRLLGQIGLIERLSLPGQRRDYFRIKPNAWTELTKQRLTQITAFRELAERGLTLMNTTDPFLCQRLEEMRDMHAFLEREMPLLLTRWEQSNHLSNTAMAESERSGDGKLTAL